MYSAQDVGAKLGSCYFLSSHLLSINLQQQGLLYLKTVGLLDGRCFLQASEDPLRAHSCSLNLPIASHSLLPLDLSPWSHGSLAEGSRFLPEEPFGSVVFWVRLAHKMFQMLLSPSQMAAVKVPDWMEVQSSTEAHGPTCPTYVYRTPNSIL